MDNTTTTDNFLVRNASDQEWHCQNTKFSRTKQRKWPRVVDDDLQPLSGKNQFELEKMKDPNVLETFQATIGGTFAPLAIMNNEDSDMDSMITTLNTAVTETASEIFWQTL